MEDIFRAFFGLNNRHDIYRRQKDQRVNEDIDDSVQDDSLPTNTPSSRVDTTVFPFNMDEILQQFVGGIFINIPDIIKEMEHMEAPPAEKNRSLRDEMLKEDPSDGIVLPLPDEPRCKQGGFWERYMWPKGSPSRIEADPMQRVPDTDLDSAVRSHGLDSVLRPSPAPSREMEIFSSKPLDDEKPSRGFVYSFSSSHSTYDGGNRKIVEKSTTRGVDGCEETVVTRSVDGETVTERVRRDRSGRVVESVVESSSSKGLNDGDVLGGTSVPTWIDALDSSAGKDGLGPPSATQRRDNVESIFKNIFGFDYPHSDNDI